MIKQALFGSDLAVGQPEGAPFDTYSRGTFVLAIDPANLREEGSAAEQGEQLFQALPRHFPDTSETPPRHFLALPGEQLFLARALLPLSPLSLSPLSLSVALSLSPALMAPPLACRRRCWEAPPTRACRETGGGSTALAWPR